MKKGIILGIVLFVAVIVAGGIVAPAGGTVAATAAEEAATWECWHPEPEPADPCGRIIYDIDMLAPDDGWAVGRDELLLHPGIVGDEGAVFRWDGGEWNTIPTGTATVGRKWTWRCANRC